MATSTLIYEPKNVKTRTSPEESFRYRTGSMPPREKISLRPKDNRPKGQAKRHRPAKSVVEMLDPVTMEKTALPDPRRWAAQIARCSLEAVEGQRPLSQLNRWMTPRQYQLLEKRRDWFTKGCSPRVLRTCREVRKVKPIAILSARCRATTDGAQEATVVLHDGHRGRASSMRLENHEGRWVVTYLRIG